MKRAQQLLAALPGRSPWRRDIPPAVDDVLLPYLAALAQASPRELRDKAANLLAFAACLTSEEARGLRVGQVSSVTEGLLLHGAGRSDQVGVPPGRVAQRCLVAAWTSWADALAARGLDQDERPALPSD